MRTPLLIAAALALVAAAPADPDWPCVQRLVPSLTASTLWGGHDATGDWRADPRITAVVEAAAPRAVPAEAASAQLERFVATIPAPDRPALLPLAFAGLVDATNAERAVLIDRLRAIARRQRALTDVTSRVTAELRALPPDAPPAQRDEVVTRRALIIREYEGIERTLRYACEAPVDMEAKLGKLARVLDRGLAGEP